MGVRRIDRFPFDPEPATSHTPAFFLFMFLAVHKLIKGEKIQVCTALVAFIGSFGWMETV
jgi:hypothetical protein